MTRSQTVIAELSTHDPAPVEPLTDSSASLSAEAMLHRILASERDARVVRSNEEPLHSIRSARKSVGVVVGVAAVAAVALVVGMVAVPGSPVRPNAAAAQVLSRAATVAADQPLGPVPAAGQFLYVKTLKGGTQSETTGNLPGWSYQFSESAQQWIAPDGSGREVIAANPTVTFLTAQDQADWAASGKPMPTAISSDNTYPAGGMAYPDSANLPTTASALEEAIVTQHEHGSSDPLATFNEAGNILEEGASPALRSALFKMIEQLPGIQDLGPMTDRLGRTGVGVGLTENGIEGQLIFDPTTSAVLQYQAVVVAPVGNGLAVSGSRPTPLPDGTVINYTVYLTTGIANTDSSVPGAASQQG